MRPRAPRGGSASAPGLGRLAVVVLLGSTAVMARFGRQPDHLEIRGALLAAAASTTWLLGLRPPARHRLGYVLAAGAVLCAGAASWRFGFAYPLAVTLVGTVLAHGALVRWSPIPALPQRRTPIAGLAIAPLVLAMVSWYRTGSPSTFAALALATAVVLEAYSRFGAVTDRLDRMVERAGHLVGRGITVLVGGAVMVFVIIPIGLVSKLFGYSPLDGGWAGPSSAWIGVDPRRQRTPDRQPVRPSSMGTLDLQPSARVRRRSRLRLTVPLAVVAALAVVAVPRILDDRSDGSGTTSSGAAAPDTFTRPFENDPAFQDDPWAKDLRTDLLDAWNSLQFNAAAGGWQIRDGASDSINVRDGERATTAPDPSLGTPLEVWLFGGSAAFGAGQRDGHTIASELVERAGADGVAVRIHNFGVPATVNWQEAMLLLARLKWDRPPDLVLVYDGANDLALQEALAAQGKGGSDQPASLVDGQLDQVLRERAEAKGLDVPAPPTADAARTPEQSGALVATRYRKGVEVIRQLCDEASVPVVIFWQPELQLKEPLSDADRATLDEIEVSDELLDRRQRFSRTARAGLDELGVVDLTPVFDGRTDALYWDSVHTNETGAALVADAMYDELAATLTDLRASR